MFKLTKISYHFISIRYCKCGNFDRSKDTTK